MPSKLITKSIFIFCVISFISLGLEFFLFDLTDYNVYRVFDISYKNVFALFLILLIQFAFIRQVPSSLTTLWHSARKYKYSGVILFFISLFACGIYSFLPSRMPIWIFFVVLGGLSGLSLIINWTSKKYFHKAITLIVFCAAFNASFIFWLHEEANEGRHIQYAQQLAERRDTIAENQLVKMVGEGNQNLKNEDQQSYWEKRWLEDSYLSSNYRYDIHNDTLESSVNYYQPVLTFDETSTPVYQIYFPSGYSLSFRLKKDFRRSIYTDNHPYKNMTRLNDYHFAVVNNGEVVLANSHNFDLNILDVPLPQVGKGEKIEVNGFDVIAYNHSNDVFVLIGEPLSEILVWISNFSFFFSLFVLATVLIHLIELLLFRKNVFRIWEKKPIHFRIQATLISLTISMFFIIAATTFFFLRQNNLDITYERELYIAETVRKAILEDKKLFDWDLADFSVRILAELADRKQCDIDLYNGNGELLLSSIATSKNSPAIKTVDNDIKESIQKNSYAILIKEFEKKGEPCLRSVFGIFQGHHLEGFAAINTFESEIGTVQDIPIIMSKILNVYVLLLLLTWGVGLSLINLLTKPLRLLANRLSLFKPGKLNEKLEWEGNDAIGVLISEYNTMVDVVEQTTNDLMRSERQGAWQIMAQQIAHEVNNPLTPLRMNIQYFTHVLSQQQTPDSDTVKRITSNLIEQVDHLSKVASQFKLFANMGKPDAGSLELLTFLTQFISLYKRKEDYQFNFVNNTENGFKPSININDEHLKNILENLITNAEHAIQSTPNGVISLILKNEENNIILEVKDNGCGIDPAIQANLFDPKFSTNSSHTGLGLPICQRIIDYYGGELSFTSETNLGTCFRVVFSIAENNSLQNG